SIRSAAGPHRRGAAPRDREPHERPVLPRDERGRAGQHLPPDRRAGEDDGGGATLRRVHTPSPSFRDPRGPVPSRRMAAPRQPLGEGAMSFARPDLIWLAFALPLLFTAAIWAYARRRRRVA